MSDRTEDLLWRDLRPVLDEELSRLPDKNRSAVVLSRAVAGHFADARHALEDPAGRWGDRDPVPRRFTPDELAALVEAAGFAVRRLSGIRVFADLVPGALVDGEPGAVEALLELEAAVADTPAFLAVATQVHLLAVTQG